MSATSDLIKFIVDTKYEALSNTVVEAAKKQTLDILGAAIAGNTYNMSGMVNIVKGWGGKEESTIIVFGGKVPAPNAALLNGILASRIDYDDTHLLDWCHPSKATIPTAFAVAERKGKVTGKDFITAITLGVDLQCRIARARTFRVMPDGAYVAVFGAAAVAGKLSGFDEKQMANTMGHAYELIPGGAGGSGAGAFPTKGLNAGLSCSAGITAALLAEKGYTADGEGSLEGPAGLYRSLNQGYFQPILMVDGLGKDFRGVTDSQKVYPCSHALANSVEAAINVTKENNIQPGDINEVIVHIGPFYASFFREGRGIPKTVIAAETSGAFLVASAIVHRELGLGNFTEEEIKDAKILELSGKKVKAKVEPDLGGAGGVRVDDPVIVEVKTTKGVYSKRVDHALGSPERPMAFDDVVAKFRNCCKYSQIPKKNQDAVIKMVKGLEDITDVAEIIRLLA
ncbi:MAG: MmgE/PrpD family protein [Dehalococcoidia bacterium]